MHRLDLCSNVANEGVKLELCCQVIADFYQKNLLRGKFYTLKHFKHMGYIKSQDVITRVNNGADALKGHIC